MINEIWNHAGSVGIPAKDLAVQPERTRLLDACSAASLRPIIGHPVFSAKSTILTIFPPYTSPRLPPKIVTSWLKNTGRQRCRNR